MSKKRRGNDEEILRRDQLDRATCAELLGKVDEDDKCVLWIADDPKDPDAKVLKRVPLRPAPHDGKRRDFD